MRFTNKLISLLLSTLLIASCFSGIVVLADSDVSQPAVSGLYIEGAPVLGQTLTLNYVVNNPDGTLDNLADEVKWYSQLQKYYRRDSEDSPSLLTTGGLTYTIPQDESLVGKYISVIIPVASVTGSGRIRTMGIGPIASSKTNEMISSSVTIVPGSDIGVGANCGDKLLGKFIAPDSEYSCQWYVSNTESGTYEAIAGATDDEYVITSDMYGKYIKFGIVLADETVLMSDNIALAGNAAFGGFVYGISNKYYAGAALNSLTNGIFGKAGGSIYTQGNGPTDPDCYFIVDLGKQIEIKDISATFTNVGDPDYCQYDCSPTGEDGTWVSMITDSPFAGTANGINMKAKTASLVSTYTARYVRIYFTRSKNIVFSELAVIAEKNEAPVITLEGDEVVKILKGQEYSEPGYFVEDLESGDLTDEVVVTGDVDTSEIGEYTLTYTVTDGTYTITATRTVMVEDGFQRDGDLAYTKDVSVSGGADAAALVDGNEFTSWTVGAGETSAVIDLEAEELVSKIEVEETGNSIESFKIYGSVDGTSYSLITLSDDGMGIYAEDVDPVKVRYLKLVVDSEDASGAVNTFCCYFDDLGKVKYAADKIEIDANLDSVTKNLPLPDSGEFDTTIEWESDNTSVVTNNGTVRRGESDKDVVLTATVTLGDASVTRDFDVTVKKVKSTKGGGGGGGSSRVSVPSIPIVVAKPIQPVEPPAKISFTDLAEDHWAYEYVDYLYELDLVSGFGDGTFGANEKLTRAQYLKMVLESLGLVAEGTCDFADVNENDWYYKYVVSAVELGIVNGMGDGVFGANSPISRQDMAVISAKALECAKLLPEFATTSVFADYEQISGYAVESVGRMNKAGIISGDATGEFRPLSTATRAEAAKIVYHLHKLKGGN